MIVEAESTMIWKLMMLKALENNANHEGIVVFIREGLNFSDVSLNNLDFSCKKTSS